MAKHPDFILTKIIATLGPACADPKIIARLIEEGARVFRINFSHGSFDQFAQSLAAIREASQTTGIPVGVLGDISGPKIRVGQVREGGVALQAGARVQFQRQAITAGADTANGHDPVFSSNYPSFIDDVQPGDRLFINDGAIRMLVTEKPGSGDDQRLTCNVTVGGLVTSAKGINLPDTNVSAPSLTEHDQRCVDWAIEHGVDFLAISFVRKAQDVRQLKQRLFQAASDPTRAIPVIAKIEKPQALDDLEAITQEADALMVARGDLGVEMEVTMVPGIQKRIIRLAHDYGKPVIVATQMLQSMIESPSPTRAEVSDVANAIYDGADAVMLSGETAVGQYPVQAVRTMGMIAQATQNDLAAGRQESAQPPRHLQESRYRTAALAHGVNIVVRDLGAKLMGIWSQQGGGARYLSQNRPSIPIIAASSDPAVLRRMTLLFAVTPIFMEQPANLGDFADKIDALIQKNGWAQQGDQVVLVAGEPIGTPGVTNTLLIHQLGRVCRLG